jgi:hypothetical protein
LQLVFLHLMKCAGTSIHASLQSLLGPDAFYPERFHLGVTRGEEAEDLSGYQVFSGHFDSLDLPHFPAGAQVFTSLRDPLDRALSHFDFWRSHDPDYLEQAGLHGTLAAVQMTALEFFSSDRGDFRNNFDNYYVRSFSGARRDGRSLDGREEEHFELAVVTLQGFAHIGKTSDVDETIDWVALQAGLDPLSASREQLNRLNNWDGNPLLRKVDPTPRTPELVAAVEAHLVLDRQLMNAVGQ